MVSHVSATLILFIHRRVTLRPPGVTPVIHVWLVNRPSPQLRWCLEGEGDGAGEGCDGLWLSVPRAAVMVGTVALVARAGSPGALCQRWAQGAPPPSCSLRGCRVKAES